MTEHEEFQFGYVHFRTTPNPQGGVNLHSRTGNQTEWHHHGRYDTVEWAVAGAAWTFHARLGMKFAQIAQQATGYSKQPPYTRGVGG
jgi:hypothetical protein